MTPTSYKPESGTPLINFWSPEGYKIESARRYANLLALKHDVELQGIAYVQCQRDLNYWVENFLWTYDPRQKPAMIPVRLFPKQREYLDWRCDRRVNKENGVIEKSRDAGVTYMNLFHHLHCWLFEDGYKGTFGSRVENLVDKRGDPDCIFEKMRMTLRWLPTWMLPQSFNWNKHDNYMRLVNPDRDSTITGQGGSNMGRGGRSTVYDVDEFAFVEHAASVDAAISSNSDCIFYTSTPQGIGNLFYQKRFSDDYQVFTIKWQDDPRKSQEWYEAQKRKFDPVIIAQEIDLDYSASIEGIYIPGEWVRAAINLVVAPVGKESAGLDVATSGKNKTVLIIRRGPKILDIHDWQGLDGTQTTYKTKEILETRGCPHLNFDADGSGEAITGPLSNMTDLHFTFTPLRGASSPSDIYWETEQKTSKQKFHNKRAELWGIVRDRFRKTYDYVHNGIYYPEEELISIPNHPHLIAQISQPLRKWTAAGKILIESKEDMRKRGVNSPDYADALAYVFHEPESGADWLDIYRL
ncbi:hypothetical protein [Chroococcidiopsis sp.]|uniref:hypothetical protein n=1 Tax=Chroococcidiopsis sp. TaxID=3088168 RepID=UPI003F323A9B